MAVSACKPASARTPSQCLLPVLLSWSCGCGGDLYRALGRLTRAAWRCGAVRSGKCSVLADLAALPQSIGFLTRTQVQILVSAGALYEVRDLAVMWSLALLCQGSIRRRLLEFGVGALAGDGAPLTAMFSSGFRFFFCRCVARSMNHVYCQPRNSSW